jgi:hypothetical protein
MSGRQEIQGIDCENKRGGRDRLSPLLIYVSWLRRSRSAVTSLGPPKGDPDAQKDPEAAPECIPGQFGEEDGHAHYHEYGGDYQPTVASAGALSSLGPPFSQRFTSDDVGRRVCCGRGMVRHRSSTTCAVGRASLKCGSTFVAVSD